MSNIVLISPFSQRLHNGQQNPKNYPYWQDLIIKLRVSGKIDEIWQSGVANEYRFEGVTKYFFNQPLSTIVSLAREASVWLSVDNFMPHLCNAYGVSTKGVVIFSRSDPKHFGYPQNVNMLKNPRFLRPDQFMIWELCNYDENAYVSADEVYNEIVKIIEPVL